MTPTIPAIELRRRALDLRDLAAAIEQLSALRLDGYAGDDTWRGSRAALCRTVLSSNQGQLHAAADRLRWRAIDFERQADHLDAAAATVSLATGRVDGQAG